MLTNLSTQNVITSLSIYFVGETVRRKVKFLLLFLLGILVFMPFFTLSIMILAPISFYGVIFSFSFLVPFLLYSYLLYSSVYKKIETKYPIIPPEGRTDIYFPRTDIPRPIHEDARRYPRFFGPKRKKKKAERIEKARRKK